MLLQDEVLELSLDDLQRSINFHNEQDCLGLEFKGSVANGAAWSSGDFLITARAVSSVTTSLRVESVSGGKAPFGVMPWARLRDLLEKDGIELSRSHAQTISDLLITQGIQEREAGQSLDSKTADACKTRIRAEQPDLAEDDLQTLWVQHVSGVERARQDLRKREESARNAVSEAVSVFFSSLGADPPVLPGRDERQTSSQIRVPTKPLVLRQWKQIWRIIKPQVEYGYNYKELSEWLRKTHPKIARGTDTLRDIAKAGTAGLLDD